MAKIVFFGTPDYVIPVLESLKSAGHKISAVVTQPDKPVGRKQVLTPSPTKLWATVNKIPVFTDFAGLPKADLGIVAAYGRIIPKFLIFNFKFSILNVHPSLLPKYRGASPVQAAIIAGDKQTGVTIMRLDEELDHGPIVSQFSEEIHADDTTGTLRARLFQKAAEVLVTILPAYLEGRTELREQEHKKATFTKILKKEDGKIDWKKKPAEIERFIRAMDPWPGAWTLLRLSSSGQAKRLKILKAHLEEGKLVPDLVQLEGKNPVSWKQFKQGYPEWRL